MRDRKKARLKAKGWKLGSADKFLGLSSKDSADVEVRLRHTKGPRASRAKRASHATVESQESRHQRIRFALAAVGAPVGAPRRNPRPADLEATLADGLVIAHRDATLARTLPLVFWRQRDRFNLDRLVAQASRRGERFSLGLFLELAGRLGHEPTLVQAARRLLDRRRTAVRLFFTTPHGPFLMALTHRYTPRVARRWGYLMNMTVDSFRTLFDKFARLDLRSPEHVGRSLRLRARLARAESANVLRARARNRRWARTMLDWSRSSAVERAPGKVGGAWVFRGTRVPVKALFENLESGAQVDEFLAWFPGVTRQQVDAVLRHAELNLVDA